MFHKLNQVCWPKSTVNVQEKFWLKTEPAGILFQMMLRNKIPIFAIRLGPKKLSSISNGRVILYLLSFGSDTGSCPSVCLTIDINSCPSVDLVNLSVPELQKHQNFLYPLWYKLSKLLFKELSGKLKWM